MKIERARIEEAGRISDVIVSSILMLNRKDYTDKQLEFLVGRNTPERILKKIKETDFYCAIREDGIVGIVSLHGASIERLYISPKFVRKGIGSLLLDHIEKIARKRRLDHIELLSGQSAVPFYEKHAYVQVEEGTNIVSGIAMPYYKMEKRL